MIYLKYWRVRKLLLGLVRWVEDPILKLTAASSRRLLQKAAPKSRQDDGGALRSFPTGFLG
jgi:hypothetical protein